MRIHTSATFLDVCKAAQTARVDLINSDEHDSRSAEHAFEIKLEGESRRRPNGGSSGAGSGYAATWDQWGVFLAHLFAIDPSTHCWAYKNQADFNFKTNFRFAALNGSDWPVDSHGDHKFEYSGTPFEHKCKKCSAVVRYN